MMDQRAIRLLLVDHNRLVRLGLAGLFAGSHQFGPITEADSAAEALLAVSRDAPDVVIIEARLADGNGVEVCRQIRASHPQTRVLMLSARGDEHAVISAMLAGASGFLLKHTEPERLIAAVHTAAAGGLLLDVTVSDIFARWMRAASAAAPGGDRLSDHERRILPLIAQGLTNRQIAARLYLSEHTVKTYVSSLLKKLQLARRSEAAAYITRQQHSRAS